MGFNCGIIGLPNVGKSTIFNALTAAGANVANYPFCTIEPNFGIVPVPDPRLDRLAAIYQPDTVVPTTIEFVDIAGLVKGASKGEGLGNQFLSHIREVDAVAHVVRCFEDENVVHPTGTIDPVRDIEIVETELIIKDLETVERRIEQMAKRAKSGDKKAKEDYELFVRMRDHLSSGRLARSMNRSAEEALVLRELHLLTDKPVMYVCNVGEDDLKCEPASVESVVRFAEREGARVVVVSAKIEAEVAELPPQERKPFLETLGITESGLERVVREGYALLDLITFFTTTGKKEIRAWTVKRGSTASQAAGVVHTDFERGFIRAEIIKYEDLIRLGSEQAVKDHGLLHIQGHDYKMEDGDIAHFRFNV